MDPLAEEALSASFLARQIVIQEDIPIRTVAVLLSVFGKLELEVSIDPRKLLGTPRLTPIINLYGMYIHFGLEECLESFAEHRGACSRYHRIAHSR